MREFILFINEDDGINDLIKAAIIHFYMAFIHPYFDGNGRMARLLHLWFLIRKGYRSALFIPFSSLIERSRKEYYGAFTAVTENKEYSRRVDVTPFVLYFTEFVYDKMSRKTDSSLTSSIYDEARRDGIITEKEDRLFKFVMSYYGRDEFSTKQLEKDCGFAAYATIRGFVLKFEKLNLLSVSKYGTRTKYRLSREEVGKMEKRIVVAGSRTFEDYEIAKVFILEVLQSFGEENTFIFLSGKCKGADALGERYAKEQGYEIEAYPADWEKYGRGAGPKRNAEMAKNCDAVICFWDGESKGTKSMIDLAKKHSKEVFIKYIDRA